MKMRNTELMFCFKSIFMQKFHSCHAFTLKEIQGIGKIKDGYNPATWMLEVTSSAKEKDLEIDFAEVYKNSELYRYLQLYSVIKLETRK